MFPDAGYTHILLPLQSIASTFDNMLVTQPPSPQIVFGYRTGTKELGKTPVQLTVSNPSGVTIADIRRAVAANGAGYDELRSRKHGVTVMEVDVDVILPGEEHFRELEREGVITCMEAVHSWSFGPMKDTIAQLHDEMNGRRSYVYDSQQAYGHLRF
ncbi:hypothetical protein CLAFUW4_03938 [Fulvia fulva]|uniref:Uncharacterized protein n=1 Tax=Passalora fulva TaxID=5499 RepID=A0A9Q8LGC2_PASFU|nr:uncharacterized protein CLAFUR5_03906 [Fulvia fulva]KAK4626543.1 hypothetical protein CLAFUR4_03924 [Fulvia fulva]KAK4628478.1 hypothetical protein CLAFUR0_03925 [Fulvia fulva]UJO16942.1 hypothetical protein CLAFUR5_03906 [Fulvia fulva]WPV13655.1 hypothetical protein CLAFUW4_03938 [Fulvia fulva]WPV28224.1 hypothetical protein CLAFUW7_03927 [Fulvia fulva]